MAALLFLPEQPVVALRRAVLAHGYQPISIYNWDARCNSPGKHAFGNNWGETKGLPPLSTEALNTGIICKNLRAIDVDIDDPKMAATAVALAEETIGRTSLVRFRSNSPRRLLLYRGVRKKLVIGKSYRDAEEGKNITGKLKSLAMGNSSSRSERITVAPSFNGRATARPTFPMTICRNRSPTPRIAMRKRCGTRSARSRRRATSGNPQRSPQSRRAATTYRNGPDRIDAEVSRRLDSPQGGRNDDLNRAAFSLGQIVAGGYLGEAEVTAALRSAAISCGLVRDDKWPSVCDDPFRPIEGQAGSA